MAKCCRYAAISGFFYLLLLGCASHDHAAYRLSPPGIQPELLDGGAFGIGPQDRADPVALTAVNDEMRQFLALHVSPDLSDQQKVQRILEAILSDGLQLSYDNFKTLTAEEAFYAQQGNCMSFTNLFVALAREVDVDVYYQEVKVPPTWAENGSTWFDNRHINAIVNLPSSQHVVDFNLAAYDVDFQSWKLDDNAALARYHNNMGVHWMSETDYQRAFLNFREAISLRPEVSYFWTNLGTLYRRQGELSLAEAAYLRAIEIGKDPAAMSNLSRLYAQVGEQELAEHYSARVHLFRRQNPYYLYQLAKQAYADQEFSEAQQLLIRAIGRNDQEHAFYELLGLVHLGQGHVEQAEDSFRKAAEIAEGEDQQRYNRKLELLTATTVD